MYDVVLGRIRSHPEAHVARRLQAGHPGAVLHTSTTSYKPDEVSSWILPLSSGGSFFACTGQ